MTTDTHAPSGTHGEALELLRTQVSLYEALQSLSRKQRDLVEREDTSPLLGLLATRQRLTVKLRELGERMAPLRQRWADVTRAMSPVQREEAQQLVATVRRCLRELIERDEHDARMLSARRQRVGSAVTAVGRSKSAMMAYRSKAVQPVGRLDQMHES